MSLSKAKTVLLLCVALVVVSFVIVQKSDLLITVKKLKHKDVLKTSRPPQVTALLNIATPQLSGLLNTSSPKVEGLLNTLVLKPKNEGPLNKQRLNMKGLLNVPKAKAKSSLTFNMLESTTPEQTNVVPNKPRPRIEGIPKTQLEASQKGGITDTSKLKVMTENQKCSHGYISVDLVFCNYYLNLYFFSFRDTSSMDTWLFLNVRPPEGHSVYNNLAYFPRKTETSLCLRRLTGFACCHKLR